MLEKPSLLLNKINYLVDWFVFVPTVRLPSQLGRYILISISSHKVRKLILFLHQKYRIQSQSAEMEIEIFSLELIKPRFSPDGKYYWCELLSREKISVSPILVLTFRWGSSLASRLCISNAWSGCILSSPGAVWLSEAPSRKLN